MINHQTSISHLGLNASGCSSPFRYVALLAFTLIFLGAAMPGSAAEPVSAKIDQGQVVIDVGGKPFTTYIFGEALKRPSFSASLKKPYFYPVIGPKSGKTVTLETMPPYPHHNSLWFGCDRVNGVDYWSVNLKVGRIVSQGAKLVEAAGERAVFTDECLWTPTGKDPIIRDTRKVTITAPSPALRFIDFDITLDPLTDLTIQKSNHSLFSGRMTPELCVTDHEKKSRGGVLINAEGKSSEKDTFGVLSPWMDFYGARDGVTEGMAILENPDNRWYPSPWFTRDYGFFSPTPMQWLKGGAIKIPKGEKFTLKYRVIVHAGDTKEAGIADLFKQYAPNAASKPLTASPDIDLTPAPAPKPKEAKPAVKAAAKPAEGKNAPEGVTGLVQENQPQPMQLAQAKAKAAKPAAKPAVGVQDAAAEEEAASKASPGGKGKAAVAEKTASMADLDKIIDDLKKYNYGQSRKATVAIEQLVLASYQSPADRKKLSDRLIELLKSDASYACKEFVCEQLSLIAADDAIPVLAEMLKGKDDNLANAARFALERIPSPKADEVLRDAIAAISGARRIGVINSLGQRRDAKAVAVLAPLAAAPDAPTAEAAIVAMGRIGSGEAAKALLALKAPAALELAKTDACLACAAHLLKDGNKAEAETICSSLSGADQPMRVRLAALKGLSQAAPEKAAGPILALLKDKDPALQLMAVKLAADAPSEQMAKALTEGLPAFAPNIQVAVLNALAAGRYKPAASAAIKAVESADESVRAAAVKSLGALGGASEIELLAKQAGGEGAVATEAAGSLERLGGADVNPAMIKAMQSGDAKARAALIRALAARNCSEATPALLAATSDADAAISKAAAKALSDLAGPKDLPKLVDLLIAAKEASQRRALEQTIAMAAAKNENAEERATPVIEGMAKAGDDAKINLLSALKTIGGAKALEAVRAQIKAANANAALRKAGVQALSGWSDAAPLDDLRALAKNDADQSIQILALRGFIQLVALPSKRSSKENVALLSDAITMAKRADEKRAVLGALPAVKCPEAMKLAESLVKDAEVGKEAELAIQTMKLDKALKFDFQPKGAPVMEGFIGVDPAMLFGEETEYGWQTPPGGTRERTAGTNLTRDFILDTAPRKFMVKLSNGEHTVTVYLGDTQSGHDKMQVKAQGQVVVPNATTAAGEVKEFTFKTTVSDGLLTLEFTKAAGSKDANWCCEGVIIK